MPEIVSGNPLNNRGSRPVVDHSNFTPKIPVAGTYRYGEYGVHFVADVVPDDQFQLRCKHVIRSYTLKAPMLQGVRMRKEYFLVPLSAILPRNYEKFIVTPNIGEDIDAGEVGTSVTGFSYLIQNFYSHIFSSISSFLAASEDWTKESFEAALKMVISADSIIGSGSLLSAMNCHILSRERAKEWDKAFDAWFAAVIKYFSKAGNIMTIQVGDVTYDTGSSLGNIKIENWHELLTILRDGFDWSVSSLTTGDLSSSDYTNLHNLLPDPSTFIVGDAVAPIDLAKFYAYQLVCAHFYSNDHVDYIYSAELYRQNINSLLSDLLDFIGLSLSDASFTWNGVEYLYDTLSSYNFKTILEGIVSYDLFDEFDKVSSGINNVFDYLRLIFGYNRSLRFQDYFTGSRTRPLAVGDAGVAVNDGVVNVIDTMQKRWYIKLWNQVNRVGRRMANQMKGFFPNVQTSTDWHDPIWLSSTEDFVNAQEVDNTGDAQIGADRVDIPVTSSFMDRAERYAFNINVNDRYGIVIGITSFDLSRFYANSIDRTFFHVDRFDKFNPFLQFTGDQKIYSKELFSDVAFSEIFAYTGKYMEYKQKVPYAFGGFINDSLPGMIFLADDGRNNTTIEHLGPNYIRSYPSELDRFYNSLTGYSLGTYFHFFIINTNEISANRPMAVNPQLD